MKNEENQLGESLYNAAYRGDLSKVKEMVSKGAPINWQSPYDGAPLIIASGNGHKNIVEFLLSKGANLDIQDKVGTALMDGSRNEHKSVVEYLILKGADLNIKDNDGRKAIDYALKADIKTILDNALKRSVLARERKTKYFRRIFQLISFSVILAISVMLLSIIYPDLIIRLNIGIEEMFL